MTLNPSAEINTNDLQSPGGVTSLYKSERQKKERRKTSKFTHCAEESPTTFFGGEGGVLLCVCVFFFLHMRKCEHLALPLPAAHSWVTAHT